MTWCSIPTPLGNSSQTSFWGTTSPPFIVYTFWVKLSLKFRSGHGFQAWVIRSPMSPAQPLVLRQAYDVVKTNEMQRDFYGNYKGLFPAELEFRRMGTWSYKESPNFGQE